MIAQLFTAIFTFGIFILPIVVIFLFCTIASQVTKINDNDIILWIIIAIFLNLFIYVPFFLNNPSHVNMIKFILEEL